MKALSVAFIGGSITSAVGNTHRIACEMDGNFSLVAGCFSRSPELNAATASQWQIGSGRVYKKWHELLEKEAERIDAVVVLTPTPQHFEVLKYCLTLGVHVICEKSLTESLHTTQNVAKLFELGDGSSHLHAVYNYTGYPMVREIRSMIANGDFGELLHCQISMPQEGFLRRNPDDSIIKPQDWRQIDHFIPTVSLDLGIHVVNLFRFVTQEKIVSVVGSSQSKGNIPSVVDRVSVLANCSNDISLDFNFGKTFLGQSNGLSISCYGTKGSVTWEQVNPEIILVSDTRGRTTSIHRGSSGCRITGELRYNRFKAGHPSGFIEAFANHYYDIANDLNTGTQRSEFTFDESDALLDMYVLQAVSESILNSQWTKVQK